MLATLSTISGSSQVEVTSVVEYWSILTTMEALVRWCFTTFAAGQTQERQVVLHTMALPKYLLHIPHNSVEMVLHHLRCIQHTAVSSAGSHVTWVWDFATVCPDLSASQM